MVSASMTQARTRTTSLRLQQAAATAIAVTSGATGSIGITAMSNLSPQVDFADLDGNQLINNDPYVGVKIIDGKLKLPSEDGIGIKLNPKYNKDFNNLK